MLHVPPQVVLFCLLAIAFVVGAQDEPPFSVSDYDDGDVYFVRDGRKRPYNGMRDAWVFNRAMAWLGEKEGADGAILCYSSQAPLLLTGSKGVSQWYANADDELTHAGDDYSRFLKKGAASEWDQATLPPVQFQIEQHPVAEFDVTQATHPWQLLVVVKGRSGPPLYASPWQGGPGTLTVDLLDLYRRKGYENHFAELSFHIATRTPQAQDSAAFIFGLRLNARAAVIPSLPVIRTAARARAEGVTVYALVLDQTAKPVPKERVAVVANIGDAAVPMNEVRPGLWKGTARDLPVGDHRVLLTASWLGTDQAPSRSHLDIHITDGKFLGYDPALRMLTRDGTPLGPLTGSYRGHPMFKAIGTEHEALVQGYDDWKTVQGDKHEGQHGAHGGSRYGFHWWESLTPKELDADYAYLERCGWTVVHLCQGWWVWERLDAGGRIAPHGAEQLALVTSAARRHGLHLHLALSHYPLGKTSAPYAQYLEAGYDKSDYAKPDSTFYRMFTSYLADFTALFRDDTGISAFTSAGEGDPACGKTFVNAVHDFVTARDPNHLFMGEPHLNPRPIPMEKGDPNFYRAEGWKPLIAGFRTYPIDGKPIESVGVAGKLAHLGHLFMGEGVFWGYSGGPRETERYRERVRETFYTSLAYRLPMLLSWEERVVEDERVVFEQVRRAVDWSKPFQRPRLIVKAAPPLKEDLYRYETALTRLPLEYAFVLGNAAVPDGTLHTIDVSAPFQNPAFASDGGKLPDALRADMPLVLPAGFAANYSWTQDRTTLLAFIRATDGARDTQPAPVGQERSIVLRNFPEGTLPYVLYDLASRKAVAKGEFSKTTALKEPPGVRHLFLLVGGRAR
jgi:hypothetical protein